MKRVILLHGVSHSGKTLAANLIQGMVDADYYHIATPFKEALKCFWGDVDVDDRNIRAKFRPTCHKNAETLMTSAFHMFREWDNRLLLPRLSEKIFTSLSSHDVLIIDGLRAENELECVHDVLFCYEEVDLFVLDIVRTGVREILGHERYAAQEKMLISPKALAKHSYQFVQNSGDIDSFTRNIRFVLASRGILDSPDDLEL